MSRLTPAEPYGDDRPRTGPALARIALALSLGACGHSGSPTVQLPAFHEVADAPGPIQQSAKAIVRIGTAHEFATGSFISPDGLLLTNNHVLGVEQCPVEGCYAEITRLYQRDSLPPSPPETIFVVPIAVDVGLDMALVQALSGSAGGSHLATPNYLTIKSATPAALQGTHIHVVGHPEGHLKKWSPGQVVDSTGAWIYTTAYILPGNSGSPLLDDSGNLVGLLHRGPGSQDLVTNGGVNEYSIASSSVALIAAMASPLPSAMRSTKASVTDDDVVARNRIYLNAHVSMATVQGAEKPVLASLGAACDKQLARHDYASPEDLVSALAPCADAMQWIECRSDAPTGDYGVCPNDPKAWATRYQAAYDSWRALYGELDLDFLTFGAERLGSSQSDGRTIATNNLEHALANASPPLNFNIAVYLAAFGVNSYASVQTVDFLRAYPRFPDYALSGTQIASTALWLHAEHSHGGTLGSSETLSILHSLAADDRIEIGAKLYIEEVLYLSGGPN